MTTSQGNGYGTQSIRAQVYLLFGREAPWTLKYLGTWSECYPAMSVIMETMNTDMWVMNTDHVDHELLLMFKKGKDITMNKVFCM